MNQPITTESVISYDQCRRKAYFLLHGELPRNTHDLDLVIASRTAANRARHLKTLKDQSLVTEDESISFVSTEDLVAVCDAVVRKPTTIGKRIRIENEPHLVVGTSSISKEHKLAVAYAGHVFKQTKQKSPSHGVVVPLAGGTRRVKLPPLYSHVRAIVDKLREFTHESADVPPLLLCSACPTCPFRDHCRSEAEETDNLTLFARMSPKLITKYATRGVFTVNQLSFLFRPRRARKRSPVAKPSFDLELQALAIRTKKIYLNEQPALHERPVELYLDIEGIPEQEFYYLIGLLVKKQDGVTMHSFWADTASDERRIFQECAETIGAFPADTPLYHYGSYEKRAFQKVEDRHGIKCDAVIERLVNRVFPAGVPKRCLSSFSMEAGLIECGELVGLLKS